MPSLHRGKLNAFKMVLSTTLFFTFWIHIEIQADEQSQVVRVESRVISGNDLQGKQKRPDTAITVVPEKTRKRIKALTDLDIPSEVCGYTVDHEDHTIIGDIHGGGASLKGHIGSDENSFGYRFIELFSVADEQTAYGIGVLVVTDHTAKKSCLVLVEADLRHNVRPGICMLPSKVDLLGSIQ